jgi:phosphohistidine swiveling domain-containing protein
LDAVKRCWASLWTARAIGYRARHNIAPQDVSLAVVVQVLVPADAAGILFTVNPLTGARSQVMINAAWGLGEAIVGGQVTPDTVVVDKASGRIVERKISEKNVMTVRTLEGTREEPVPKNQRAKAVLSQAQAAELAHIGMQIETLYGMPMDIEWTLKDGTFAIVQARPITALPEPPAPELEWVLPDLKLNYFRGSVIELMPAPLTPLFGTLGLGIVNAGTVALFDSLFGQGVAPRRMLTTVNDYAYFGLKLTPRFIWRMLLVLLSVSDILRSGDRRWQEARQRYLETIRCWQTQNLDDVSAQDILTGTRELTAGAVGIYNELQAGVVASAMTSEAVFTGVYDRLIRRKGDPPAQTFLLGFDSTPILAEKALYDLTEWCRTRPGLTAYLSDTAAPPIIAHLRGDQTPAGVEAGDWQELQSHFGAYLQQYGHILYDLDFASPTPADDPIALVQTCKLFASGQGTNPHERQRAAAERREQATETMLASLRGLRLKWFHKLVTWAQRHVPLREDSLADIGLGYPLLRRILHELGQRCAAAGAIDQIDDVYWLIESEAIQAAAALDQGEPVSSLADAIRQRKARWEVESKVTPPASLPLSAKGMSALVGVAGPARTSGHTEDTIKGVGASPGQVTAPARVLHGPQDFDQMRPGDVLVAAITTPAWTPLFAMASGVVTDIGGPLSHGSIVAREYGIPAVLGTGVATKRIRSGQMITVDGSVGAVTLKE